MGKSRVKPPEELAALALIGRLPENVRGQFSEATQERAARHYASTEIHFYGNGAAVVSSPRSGTEHTIDQYGNCQCSVKRGVFCWHLLCMAIRLMDEEWENV